MAAAAWFAAGRGRGRSTGITRATLPGRAVITTIRSAMRTASPTEWVTSTTVRGRSIQRRWSSPSKPSRVSASSALNGSSRRSTGGSLMSARARPARWAIPPESCAGRTPAASASPTRSSASSRLLASLRDAGTPARASGSATLSTVESQGTRRGCWKARPTRPSPARGAPPSPSATLPLVGATSPAMTRSSVLLPHPFGPMITVRLPAGMSRLRPRSASSGSPAAGKETLTSDEAHRQAGRHRRPARLRRRLDGHHFSRYAWHRARGSAAERPPARLPQARRRAPSVCRCVGERLAVAFSHPDCDRRPCLPASVALAGSGRPRQVCPDRRSSASGPDGVRGLARVSEPTAGGDFHPAPKAMKSFSCRLAWHRFRWRSTGRRTVGVDRVIGAAPEASPSQNTIRHGSAPTRTSPKREALRPRVDPRDTRSMPRRLGLRRTEPAQYSPSN